MRKAIFFLTVLLLIGGVYSLTLHQKNTPEEVIHILRTGIETAQIDGEYNCCIEPACTMCYLGEWKFDKGTCFCDDAVKDGRDEDVCPECKKGLEEGICSSLTTKIPGSNL